MRSRYIKQLDIQETRLEDMSGRQKDLEAELIAGQKKLDALIESLGQDLTIE